MRRGQFNFLDIPVYRLPEDHYYAERSAYADAEMTKHPLPTTPANPSSASRLLQDAAMLDHLYQSYGGPWQYNEIIGHLRLHFLGSQVRAEYWRVQSKRIVRTRRKIFNFNHWKLAPETELPMDGASEEIFAAVMQHVQACKAELKGRYVDTSTLEALGPYIDWRGLLHGP
ncbi:MAG: hypothetical protein WA140_00845 [Geobacteraceae bacterium]